MWDNDIISQTFRTSVRFLKRNNDDNKTLNGTQFLTDGLQFLNAHQGAHKAMQQRIAVKSGFQRHLASRNLHYLRFVHKLRPLFPISARGPTTLHSKPILHKIFSFENMDIFQFDYRRSDLDVGQAPMFYDTPYWNSSFTLQVPNATLFR